MYINRILKLPDLLAKKSFFLFGPRSTGKSSLILRQLKDHAVILNLLRNDIYLRLVQNPSSIENILPPGNDKFIVIDEIQRIPALLNEVHRLIEERDYKFLLTGSSARKLLRSDANLLAGRARKANMFPLTYQELVISDKFNLQHYLLYGGLPQVYLSDEPQEELLAYVDTYLKDEIQREALVRNIDNFSRFFSTCAQTNGQVVNFTSISQDCSIPCTTVREYYQILEDTLIGFMLPPWTGSTRSKTLKSYKFYLFDIGVANYLNQISELPPQTGLYGNALEHFVVMEIRAFISYKRKNWNLSYWRTSDGVEVDLIIDNRIAIEIKASEKISNKHCKGLNVLRKNKDCEMYIIISQDFITKSIGDIHNYHWKEFFELLWNDHIQ